VQGDGEGTAALAGFREPAHLLALQRTAGNAAVARAMLQREAQNPTVTSVANPEYRGQGEYEWKVRFGLPKPADEDGAIVQEIRAWAGPRRQSIHFWEAWPVKKGQTAPTSVAADHDDAYGWDKSGPTGKHDVEGTARFYEEDVEEHGFNTRHRYAGELPATDTKPGFWDNTGTEHDLGLTWSEKAVPGEAAPAKEAEDDDPLALIRAAQASEETRRQRALLPLAEREEWAFATTPKTGDIGYER
jgi:hypothetical protein